MEWREESPPERGHDAFDNKSNVCSSGERQTKQPEKSTGISRLGWMSTYHRGNSCRIRGNTASARRWKPSNPSIFYSSLKGFPKGTDSIHRTPPPPTSTLPIHSALEQSQLSYLSPSAAPFQMDLTNTRSRLPPPPPPPHPPPPPSSSSPPSPSRCSSSRSGLGHFSASHRCTCGRGRGKKGSGVGVGS